MAVGGMMSAVYWVEPPEPLLLLTLARCFCESDHMDRAISAMASSTESGKAAKPAVTTALM